jgi:hypothetical protein
LDLPVAFPIGKRALLEAQQLQRKLAHVGEWRLGPKRRRRVSLTGRRPLVGSHDQRAKHNPPQHRREGVETAMRHVRFEDFGELPRGGREAGLVEGLHDEADVSLVGGEHTGQVERERLVVALGLQTVEERRASAVTGMPRDKRRRHDLPRGERAAKHVAVPASEVLELIADRPAPTRPRIEGDSQLPPEEG